MLRSRRSDKHRLQEYEEDDEDIVFSEDNDDLSFDEQHPTKKKPRRGTSANNSNSSTGSVGKVLFIPLLCSYQQVIGQLNEF